MLKIAPIVTVRSQGCMPWWCHAALSWVRLSVSCIYTPQRSEALLAVCRSIMLYCIQDQWECHVLKVNGVNWVFDIVCWCGCSRLYDRVPHRRWTRGLSTLVCLLLLRLKSWAMHWSWKTQYSGPRFAKWWQCCNIHCVSKKFGVELFAISSSAVNRFLKILQQWITYKIYITFLATS